MAMNSWVGGPRLVDGTGQPNPEGLSKKWKLFIKMNDLGDPGASRIFVFLDERCDSINNGYFTLGMEGYSDRPAAWNLWNYPASYHNRMGNLSFADGHTESHRWTDSRTMAPLRRNVALDGGPSPNNPDA